MGEGGLVLEESVSLFWGGLGGQLGGIGCGLGRW